MDREKPRAGLNLAPDPFARAIQAKRAIDIAIPLTILSILRIELSNLTMRYIIANKNETSTSSVMRRAQ